ncbi:exonuclease V, chloroplastic [Silene latifolia]|uniref:exonuclease V, chloroplastic n=1 Tax=Silene latifolia TaxID=37657 RepID=UPI003D788D3A
MTDSTTNNNKIDATEENQIEIPIEIVSEEEMALIESAFSLASAARRSFPCSRISRGLSSSCSSGAVDFEDLGRVNKKSNTKNVKLDSLLIRFRKKRGLYVTDITATEWCEKQMEFGLLFGKPKITDAMKAGIARHAKLEEEVTKKVEVRVETLEDIWALKFINFTICANQLMFDGLTRELPVVGLVQGVWMVGVIDELRMPVTENGRNLVLVDTKTRRQPRIPAEPQCRNGRLQLMCYKYLWDKLVSDEFPSKQFYEYFSLDPEHTLSDDIKMSTADSGFPAETFGEVVNYFRNVCSTLPPAHDQLLLRYELQDDNSLIAEDEFSYDDDWLNGQISSSLEFWQGQREAKYVLENEVWKCRFCQFARYCPSQTDANSETNFQTN